MDALELERLSEDELEELYLEVFEELGRRAAAKPLLEVVK